MYTNSIKREFLFYDLKEYRVNLERDVNEQ